MKNIQHISFSFICFCIFLSLYIHANTQNIPENNFIAGKILDAETDKPVAFVSVALKGSNTGTVSNTEGDFLLRFDDSVKNKVLVFKYIGYKNQEISLNALNKDFITVRLHTALIPIQEIIVRPNNPEEIIRGVIEGISKNYSNIPEKNLAFYREYIKKRRKYVSVSEAVVEIYKAAYDKAYSNDMVKLRKGHKSIRVKAQDTVALKLKGGPATALLLDIAKHPYILFSEENLKEYDFSLDKIALINNKQNYIINFRQKPNFYKPLYNGKLYVDVHTLAISAAEFWLNLADKRKASKVFVSKKPLSLKIRPENTKYIVNYSEKNGKYYFSHARAEIMFSVKWKKRLFKSRYSIMTEIAITDRTNKNVQKIPHKERLKSSVIFDEKVQPFSDEDFWGKYNIIKPEESIEKTIKKYGVRLKISD